MRELARLVVSCRPLARASERSSRTRRASSPITAVQANATNPAIPHVAKRWLAPLLAGPAFILALIPNITAAAPRDSLKREAKMQPQGRFQGLRKWRGRAVTGER